MNLLNQFKSLSIPDGDYINAERIDKASEHRIGKTFKNYPVILFEVENVDYSLQNISLQYVKALAHVSCVIHEQNVAFRKCFTVIIFESNDLLMQYYFIRLSEALISSIPKNPTERDILGVVNKFVALLEALTEAPTKSVQGLWAELCFVTASPNPVAMMKLWHLSPKSLFDFELDTVKIEVKSSLGNERIHYFSFNQLLQPPPTQIYIASILLQKSSTGKTIHDLRQHIAYLVRGDFELIHKLDKVIAKTLGSSIIDSSQVAYDYNSAKSSIRYYLADDIPKIMSDSIPLGVSEVKYRVDMNFARGGVEVLPFVLSS